MATLTVYGNTDGYISYSPLYSGTNWAQVIAAATGDGNANNLMYVQTRKNSANGKWSCLRGFITFDLSELPVGATIDGATLYVYCKSTGSSYTKYYRLYDANYGAIQNDDYDLYGTTSYSDTIKETADWTVNAYNTYEFNSAGKNAIQNGNLKICLRERSDYDGSPEPETTVPASINPYIQIGVSADAGIDYDPYIVVDYTVASTNKIVGIL